MRLPNATTCVDVPPVDRGRARVAHRDVVEPDRCSRSACVIGFLPCAEQRRRRGAEHREVVARSRARGRARSGATTASRCRARADSTRGARAAPSPCPSARRPPRPRGSCAARPRRARDCRPARRRSAARDRCRGAGRTRRYVPDDGADRALGRRAFPRASSRRARGPRGACRDLRPLKRKSRPSATSRSRISGRSRIAESASLRGCPTITTSSDSVPTRDGSYSTRPSSMLMLPASASLRSLRARACPCRRPRAADPDGSRW